MFKKKEVSSTIYTQQNQSVKKNQGERCRLPELVWFGLVWFVRSLREKCLFVMFEEMFY